MKQLILVLFVIIITHGDEGFKEPVSPAPGLARRGIESLRKGNYELARSLLEQSLREAVMVAREDWVARAVLNLADLELQTGRLQTAEGLLTARDSWIDPNLNALRLWLLSQVYFENKQLHHALLHSEKALNTLERNHPRRHMILKDHLRILLDSLPLEKWNRIYSTKRDSIHRRDRANWVSLEAERLTRLNRFSEAIKKWDETINYFREEGSLAKMGKSMLQKAWCLKNQGKTEESEIIFSNAREVFFNLNLPVPESFHP